MRKTLHETSDGIPEVRGLVHPQWWCSVCDFANMFLTSKFSYLLVLVTTRIKTKIGTARLLMANHLHHSNHDWPTRNRDQAVRS
jgi:hypothetical protein